jgi:hypothetical protein
MYIYIYEINAMDAIFLIHLCDDCYKLFNTNIFSITHEIQNEKYIRQLIGLLTQAICYYIKVMLICYYDQR